MNNDTVRSIAVKDNKIFGVTAEGLLTMFDEELGRWVVRCDAEVLCADKSSVLRSSFVNPAIERPIYEPEKMEVAKRSEPYWKREFVLIALILTVVGTCMIAALVFIQ